MKRSTELPFHVRLLFEDESILIIDKPSGLLTIATETERDRTAYAALRAYQKRKRPPERLFIVHRLDREASGLLVFAKSADAKERLQSQFEDHTAGRTYVAVVDGQVKPDRFEIRSHLAENAARIVYSTTNLRRGRLAVTHVRVLERRPRTSVVEVRLETGRKHQIRVHMAERGHPIVGDVKYGGSRAKRLALHGAALEFRHPRTGRLVRFESPALPLP